MPKLFKVLAIVVTLVIILPVIIGAFLSREHAVSRSEEFAVSTSSLWETIASPESQNWRRDIKSVATADRTWTETYTNSSRREFKVIAEDMPNRLVRRLSEDGFSGEWEFKIDRTDSGARLTIIERSSIDNAFLRFINRLFRGDGRSLDHYFDDLKKRFS